MSAVVRLLRLRARRKEERGTDGTKPTKRNPAVGQHEDLSGASHGLGISGGELNRLLHGGDRRLEFLLLTPDRSRLAAVEQTVMEEMHEGSKSSHQMVG
jgi:hypothetical protein